MHQWIQNPTIHGHRDVTEGRQFRWDKGGDNDTGQLKALRKDIIQNLRSFKMAFAKAMHLSLRLISCVTDDCQAVSHDWTVTLMLGCSTDCMREFALILYLNASSLERGMIINRTAQQREKRHWPRLKTVLKSEGTTLLIILGMCLTSTEHSSHILSSVRHLILGYRESIEHGREQSKKIRIWEARSLVKRDGSGDC